MNVDPVRARYGSLGPRAVENLPGGVRRLITEDLPKLLAIAAIADTMVKEFIPLTEDTALYYKNEFAAVLNDEPKKSLR